MSNLLEPFLCPDCHQLVKSDEISIAEHYGSGKHDKGLFERQPPQPNQQQNPPLQLQVPVPPSQQYQQPQQPPPGAYPTNQQWPQGNMPQIPATRFLSWHKQIKGMWYYYRTGMVYWSIIIAFATIALLTRL